MAAIFLFIAVSLALVSLTMSQTAVSTPDQSWADSPYVQSTLSMKGQWFHGSATYYGFSSASACGFPYSWVQPDNSYGIYTAATPGDRYDDTMTFSVPSFSGAACGSCYVLQCLNVPLYSQEVFCTSNTPQLHVRIADCDVPRPGGWPNNHFDLDPSGYSIIADLQAGMVNVMWARESCSSTHAKWMLHPDSNGFFHDIIIYDVPATGSVVHVWLKPAGGKWIKAGHSWGAHWWAFGAYNVDGSTKVSVTLAEHWGRKRAQYTPIGT